MIQTTTVIAASAALAFVLYWPLLIAAAGAEYLRWRIWSKR